MTKSSEPLSPEQIKAARALLAWSQQDLATAAKVATSTLADFERGFRTPVANNAQAIREALEAQGLSFIAGGVVSKSMLPAPPPGPHAGALVRWINATDLSQWGERRDGQASMPELLGRLIYATVGPAAQIRFPSDDSVHHPGWDGVCLTAEGAGPFVPQGASVWEIGSQRSGVRGKADKDFVKRSAQSLGRDAAETVFVFVTPQRFQGKDAWVAEKRALGLWRDVVAIDADDLVHWLETAPAVAQWLAVRIGRRPAGLRNMEEVWAEWVRATETPLTPDVLLAGRDDEQKAVFAWLNAGPEVFALQAEAPDEAMAFLYAAVAAYPPAYRLAYWSRCVVADSAEVARQLIGLGTPLIIVLAEPDPGLARRLVEDGHHVFGVYGPNATAFGDLRSLPRPWRYDLERALTHAGLSEEEAHRLAHLSGRSITVLRRIMPAAPQYRAAWAARASPELIAALFAGAWVDHNPLDRQILGDLAGQPYEAVAVSLAPLAELGGPLVRAGSVWKVVSPLDLWTQIAGQIAPDQFDRHEAAFQRVLGAVNRRYDRRPKSPYFEEDGEFGPEPSNALRKGLTEVLIAMAVYADRASASAGVAARPAQAIRALLKAAPAELWWSLSRDFHNLAEAAPDVFLDALEDGLDGTAPAVLSLFRSDEGLMHPTEYLSNLLWALEMLARSRDYLTRVALLLARLDALDPGESRWGNRPGASLRRIFVIWSPQTYATPEQRLKVIDRVLREVPATGWKLLLNLAPRTHDSSEPSSKPNWRDFTPDEPEVITWQSVGRAAEEIGARLLDAVQDDPDRWVTLIDRWASFGPDWRARAARQVQALAAGPLDPAGAEALRDKIRDFVQRHRGFSDAEWALAEADLAPLDAALEALAPVSVEDRVRWLFKPGARARRPGIGWREQEDALEADQTEAAQSLVEALDLDALIVFASTVTLHRALGVAVSRTSAPAAFKAALLKRGLRSLDPVEADLGFGLLYGLRHDAGAGADAWAETLWRQAIAGDWGETAEARIVGSLPTTPATWAAIDARSPSLALAYWKTVSTYRLPDDVDPAQVVDRLSAAGRNRDAVAWLGNIIEREPDSDLLIRALHAAAGAEEPLEDNDATMFSYYVGLIFGRLDQDPDVSEAAIVSLEWTYFQALRHSERPPRTIHRAMARDPELFCFFITLIYLPAKDSDVEEPDPEDAEKAAALASQAYSVLHEWAHVPGADDEGRIDGVALEAWVKAVRKQLKAVGRGDIGDSKIGEILSAARRDPDQPWPPEPVREVIETARSRVLESGFEIGVFNRRGVTTRMPQDGGEQERVLANRYRADAEALRFDWPRTSASLERIAAGYDHDAKREDDSAQQRDWL